MNDLITKQIELFHSLGIIVELCGSLKMNESTQFSDIDLRCFCKQPEMTCRYIQKYYDYIYPYRKYINNNNDSDIVCNLKYFIKSYQFDLTFFPIAYKDIYVAVENYRNKLNKSKTTQIYLQKKILINKMMYGSSNLFDRKIYLDVLKKIKSEYFRNCIDLFSYHNNIDSKVIYSYMDLKFVGSYIGFIKINK